VDTRAFVSYASQDAAVANSIVESLEQHGIKCWLAPRDVTPGSQYADEIVEAINNSQVFVLVLSEHALASAHVGRELERAASKRRRVIVLRIDAASLTRSFEYFLSESQWIDVAALGVPAALTKLAQAVGQRLAPASWVSPGLGADVRDPADQKRKPSYLTIKRGVTAAMLLVAAAVVVGVMTRYWPSKQGVSPAPAAAAISDKSIAVLPFTDMSEKKDQEYFADGMAEEIIDLLVKVPGLKVISRTSSFQFKGKTEDLRNIGTQLGVAYVLEGSVRKSGDRVRITAQLIDSRDGAHLMSQSYDRDFSDVLKMQDEIAASLVRVLQVEVSEHVLVARASLSNTQAYMLYLQGLHAKDRFDRQGFEQAVNDFQQALELDPSFAGSAAGLANAYFLLGQFGFLEPSIAFDKAREAAQRALELDPKLAATHALLGNIDIAYEWDWAAASEQIQLALADAPKDAYVLFIAAVQAQVMGRQDEALKLIGASLAQDPLNPSSYLILSYIQIRRERPVEAEAALRRTLQISPTFIFAHYYLGLVLLARGDAHGAIEEVGRENDEGLRLAGSAIVDFAVGAKADSDAALKQMLKTHAQRAYEIAGVYAFRGETDEAFQWLDRAYSQKDPYLVSIKGNPMLKKIESDPRYKAFLKKMNLPEG
jgi:TolB-like protein/thioredoxin-like negative regulator of GroEL